MLDTAYISRMADVIEATHRSGAQKSQKIDAWTMVYRTKGGTVIVASTPNNTDSGLPRDLMAVLPMDLGQGRVIPLYLAVNPETVEKLEAELKRRSSDV